MPRPLRIQYPDAWYHVMNRGRRGEDIFTSPDDFRIFLKLLQETSHQFKLKISAYCLMPNHYHLLVQTPLANLSRCMRHINGVYTQQYNRLHECDSQLFRGRYKSLLIEENNYLLEVLRYIHRNPIKAGMEKKLGEYPWSSHKAYVSSDKKWEWLNKKFLLNSFSSTASQQKKLYRNFVQQEEPEFIENIFTAKKSPSVLGDELFVQKIRKEQLKGLTADKYPELKEFAPSMDQVVSSVCDQLKVKRKQLMQAKRGVRNEARDITIYMIRNLCMESHQNIAKLFQLTTISAISSAIARVKNRMEKESAFKKKVHKIEGATTT